MASIFDLEKTQSGSSAVSGSSMPKKKPKSIFDLEQEFGGVAQSIAQQRDVIKPAETQTSQIKPVDQVEHEKSWEQMSFGEKFKSTMKEIPSTIGKYFQSVGKALESSQPTIEKPWDAQSIGEKTKSTLFEAPETITRPILSAGLKTASSLSGIGGFLGIEGSDKMAGTVQEYQYQFQKGLAPKTYKEDDNIFQNPALLVNPEYILRNVTEQVPNFALMSKTKGFGEGILELGGAFNERMLRAKEKGEDATTVDRVYAGTIGLINGYLGKIGFDTLLEKNPKVRQVISQKVGEKVAAAVSAIGSTASEMGTEYLQEVIPQIATKIIYDEGGSWGEVLSQANKQGLSAASSAGVISAPIAGVNVFAGGIDQSKTSPAVLKEEQPTQTALPTLPPGGIPPAIEQPIEVKQQASKTPELFDALESGDESTVTSTISNMSKGDLEEAKMTFEKILSSDNEMNPEDIMKASIHLDKVNELLDQRSTEITKKAEEIVKGGVSEGEIATVLNKKDEEHSIKIAEKVLEKLDVEKQALLEKKSTAAPEQKKEIQSAINSIDESRNTVKSSIENVKKTDVQKPQESSQNKEISREDFSGFGSEMAPMNVGKVKAVLNKKTIVDGKEVTKKEFVENLASKGSSEAIIEKKTNKNGDKVDSMRIYEEKDGSFFEVSKAEFDYFNHIKEAGVENKKTPKEKENTTPKETPSVDLENKKIVQSDKIEDAKSSPIDKKELTKQEESATVKPINKDETYERPRSKEIPGAREIQQEPSRERSTEPTEEISGYDRATVLAQSGNGLGGDPVDVGTKKQRQLVNTQVETLLEEKDYSQNADDYSAEEKVLMSNYSGAGGKESVGGEGSGLLNEYYTPKIVIDKMWGIVGSLGKKFETAFEPSAGTGRIISAAPKAIKIDGAEISKVSGTIAKVLNPDSEISIGDFQEIFFDKSTNKAKETKKYDLVIGNPPFGARAGFMKGKGEEPSINRMEEYFIKRGLDMVNPGGYLVYVVNSGFLQTGKSKGKEAISKIGELVKAYRLPEKSFEDTSIGTDIVVFKKSVFDQATMRIEPREGVIMNDAYFNENPGNILGEVKTRKNRFGKEETYIEGDLQSAMDKIVVKKIETREKIDKKTSEIAKTAEKREPKKRKAPLAPSKQVVLPKPNYKTLVKPETNVSNKSKVGSGDIEMLKKIDRDLSIPNPTDTEKRNLNYVGGKYYPDASYFSGEIYKKIEDLKKNRKDVIATVGEERYQKQLSGLEKIVPKELSVHEIMFEPLDTQVSSVLIQTDQNKQYTAPDTVMTEFNKYLRGNKAAYNPKVTQYDVMLYVNGRNASKGTKPIMGFVKADAKRLFNEFVKNELDESTQKYIVDKYNKEKNGYVRPNYSAFPLEVKDMATHFRGDPFSLSQTQKDGVGLLVNKGSGLIAYGVGVGKTHTLAVATKANMDKGWTKRPLFIVPKSTLEGAWINTLHEMFPGVTINNLGGLQAPIVRKLKKERGENTQDWVKDGEISVITHEGILRLGFKPEEFSEAIGDLSDALDSSEMQTKRKKETGKDAKSEILGRAQRYVTDVMISDLGFDHISVDEVHNFRKIFQGAKPEGKNEEGGGGRGRFSNVVGGTPSKRAQQLFLISQHIQKNNGGRNVFLASATPFENHATEVYNILSLVARDRMKSMGIFNINDFFATYANFEVESDRRLDGEWVNREKMKSFSNIGSLQELLREFIDYQEDETLIRPERRVLTPHLSMSPKQVDNLAKIQDLLNGIDRSADIPGEASIKEKPEDGAFLKASTYSIANSVSPYFIKEYVNPNEDITAKKIVDSSPKIEYALEVSRKIKSDKRTKNFGTFIFFGKMGVEYHPMLAEYFAKELGYKKDEVAYLSGDVTDDKKEQIKNDFNSGKIKVLLGGDQTKEGIDLQNNGFATINLALGWNPTQIAQVEGRVWRQGNNRSIAPLIYPLVENSGDATIYSKFEEKGGRINDLFSYAGTVFDVGEIDPAEKKMALLTNPQDKTTLQISMDKVGFENDRTFLESKVKSVSALVNDMNDAKGSYDFFADSLKKTESPERRQYFKDKLKSEKQRLDRLMKRSGGKTADQLTKDRDKALEEIKAIDEKIAKVEERRPELLEKFTKEFREQEKNRKSIPQHVEDVSDIIDELSVRTPEEISAMRAEKIKAQNEKRKNQEEVLGVMKSITDGKIETFIGKDYIERQIETLRGNIDPYLAKKLVMDITQEIVDEVGGRRFYSGGQYSKFTGVAQIAQRQSVESMEESVIHEPAHFAWMHLTDDERASITKELKGKSIDERRKVFGESVNGGWRYDMYVKEYGGDENSLIEEMAVTIASKEALDSYKRTGKMYSESKNVGKIQKIIQNFVFLYNRIAGIISKKLRIRVPFIDGMDIMREIYNSRGMYFENRQRQSFSSRSALFILSDAKTKNELSDEIETRIGYLDTENIDEFIAAESLRAILGRIESTSLSDAKSRSEDIIRGVIEKRGEKVAKSIGKEKKASKIASIAEGSRSFSEFSFNLKKGGYDVQKEFESKSAAEDFYNRSSSTMKNIVEVKEKPLIKNGKVSLANLYKKVYSELYEGKAPAMKTLAERKIIKGMTKRAFTLGKRYATKVTKENYKAVNKEIKDYVVKNLDPEDRGEFVRDIVNAKNAADTKALIEKIDAKVAEITLHRSLRQAVETLITEKNFQKDRNLRIAMKLPTVAKMDNDQLKLYYSTLSQFKENDEFLSQRKIETLKNTELIGIKTLREAKERLAERAGKPLSSFENVTTAQFDRFRYDTALAESNPFYGIMVDDTAREMLKREEEYLSIEETANEMLKKARASRKRSLLEKAIPTDSLIYQYLNAEDKTEVSGELTDAEMEAAVYIEAQYRRMYEYLVENQMLGGSRFVDNYVTHLYRGFLEAWKADGLKEAIREIFVSQKKQEAMFKIVSGTDTKTILPYEKFFQFAQFRSGVVKPTENVAKAFLTYTKSFQKKRAIDELIPKLMTYVQAITPQEKTEGGLKKDSELEKFVKEWINNKKGRRSDFGGIVPQGGKIDTSLRIGNALVTILDIGLNVASGIASIGGEQVSNYVMLGAKQYAKGTKRMLTAQGKNILSQHKAFVGKNPWSTLVEEADNIGDTTLKGLFVLFRAAQVRANKQFLLGAITDKEFESGEISDDRMAQLQREMGRWRVVEDSKSIIGSTSVGSVANKYKTWAVPILRTTLKDSRKIIADLKSGQGRESFQTKEAQEMARVVIINALVAIAISSIFGGDDEDKSFMGKLVKKFTRDLLSTVGALNPKTFIAAPRLLTFMIDFANGVEQLVTAEEYQKDGVNYDEGDLKAPNTFERILTPQAIKQIQ